MTTGRINQVTTRIERTALSQPPLAFAGRGARQLSRQSVTTTHNELGSARQRLDGRAIDRSIERPPPSTSPPLPSFRFAIRTLVSRSNFTRLSGKYSRYTRPTYDSGLRSLSEKNLVDGRVRINERDPFASRPADCWPVASEE